MSDGTVDPSVQRAIDALAVPGLLIGHRVISQGDELALLHEEMASLSFPAIERRRASGAARRVARELMNSMGFAGLPILRSTFGAPIWPAGVVGSMAHDDRIAVAAVGLQRDLDAVGIDIEPAVPLPPDMLELIATPRSGVRLLTTCWGQSFSSPSRRRSTRRPIRSIMSFWIFTTSRSILPAGSRRPEPDARSRSTGAFSLTCWSWRRFRRLRWTTCPRVEKARVRSTAAL